LTEIIANTGGMTESSILQEVHRYMEDYTRDVSRHDDVTVLTLRISK
jgi:hypothetical protein